MTLASLRPLAGLVVLLAFIAPSAAAESAVAPKNIVVELDHAKIFRLPEPASTIVIGNPTIADASLQNAQTLIITGHAYGETNLIVLDPAGEMVSETRVSVSAPSDGLITVYKGVKRSSLSCQPDCQPAATMGDDAASIKDVVDQAQQRISAVKELLSDSSSSSSATVSAR